MEIGGGSSFLLIFFIGHNIIRRSPIHPKRDLWIDLPFKDRFYRTMTYSSILIKLSGEQFADQSSLFSRHSLGPFLDQVRVVRDRGVAIGIVVGGGNIYRGNRQEFSRIVGDFMGMYATMINGLALGEFLRELQIPTAIQSSLTDASPFDRRDPTSVHQALSSGKVVIFCGGTGRPFFSTDTAAALAAIEMDAQLMVKLTDVDGVYGADPKRFPEAEKFERIDFELAIEKRLKILDETAFHLCRDHRIPIRVLSIHRPNGLEDAAGGRPVGTLIYPRASQK